MDIYRGYDQAGLDAQYNNRAMVPDYPTFLERWTRASAEARARLGGHLDLGYGPGPRDRLDLFPASGPRAPILAFLHGGYWQALGKEDFSWLAPPFVEAGVTFAVVGYPLAPASGLDEIVEHVRAGLHWLWKNAEEAGGDPERLFVAGHSAGGHLVAMALTAEWAARGDAPADMIKGGTGISGLYDLEPIRLGYLNGVLGLDEAAARRNSPIHNLESACGSLLLTVGGDESDEYHRQTAEFAAAWRARGLPCEVVDQPGRHHFNVLDALAEADNPLHRTVLRQIFEP